MPPSPVLGLLLAVRSVKLAILALVLLVLPIRPAFVVVPLVIVATFPVVIPLHLDSVMVVVRPQGHRGKQSCAKYKST
jgi:hypothetical protein